MNAFFKKSLLFIILFTAPLAQALNVVFDLGGVLIDSRKFHSAREIGLLNLLFLGQNPVPLFFNFLDSIKQRNPAEALSCDDQGNLIPQLMCDWMTGAQTPAQIINEINTGLVNNTVLNNRERKVIKGMAEFMFGDQETYIKTKKIIRDGRKFVKKCKKKGHKVYILSNWDAPSFKELEAQFPKFFSLFDGILISGDAGVMKPDPEIYQILLEKFDLDVAQTAFLDDRPENIAAAQEQGIHGILCENADFKTVRKQFSGWEKQFVA